MTVGEDGGFGTSDRMLGVRPGFAILPGVLDSRRDIWGADLLDLGYRLRRVNVEAGSGSKAKRSPPSGAIGPQ